MKCPKCGNESCTIMTQKTTPQNDYSFCTGVCGMALFGPLGSICGWTNGSEQKIDVYWVCKKCGYRFKS